MRWNYQIASRGFSGDWAGSRRFFRDSSISGQSMVEYALLLALVAVALVASLTAFSDGVKVVGDKMEVVGASGS